MSNTAAPSDEAKLLKYQADSFSFEEGNSESGGGEREVLKKGPWTSAEDALLIEYVRQYGEGNWNAVQKCTQLSRCGKSCRLRWANHLRPNLKKGAFTEAEEKIIVEEHAVHGNKWAKMAAKLPGRTDNEIKNFWNTRSKRCERAGLPIYPPEVCLKLNRSLLCQNDNEFNSSAPQQLSQVNKYEVPDVVFDHCNGYQGFLSYAPTPDIPLTSMLTQAPSSTIPGISVSNILKRAPSSSQGYNFLQETLESKRLRLSQTLLPDYSCTGTNGSSQFDHPQNGNCGRINYPSALSFSYGPDSKGKNPAPYGALPGSHALASASFSASKLLGGSSSKFELSSVQISDLCDWSSSSPRQPPLESADNFMRSPSPFPSELVQSDCPSSKNSGLLDTLLYEAQSLSNGKNQSPEERSNTCTLTPGDNGSSSTVNLGETGWEVYVDPSGSMGPSATSVLSENTPGCRGDERQAPKALSGYYVKPEPVEYVVTPASKGLELPKIDPFLDLDWYELCGYVKERLTNVTDDLSTMLVDDLCNGYKQLPIGTSTFGQGCASGTSTFSQGCVTGTSTFGQGCVAGTFEFGQGIPAGTSTFGQGGVAGTSTFGQGCVDKTFEFGQGIPVGTSTFGQGGVAGTSTFGQGSAVETSTFGFGQDCFVGTSTLPQEFTVGTSTFDKGCAAETSTFGQGCVAGTSTFAQEFTAGTSTFGQGCAAGTSTFGQGCVAGTSTFAQEFTAGTSTFGQGCTAGTSTFGQECVAGTSTFAQEFTSGTSSFDQGSATGTSTFGQGCVAGTSTFAQEFTTGTSAFGQGCGAGTSTFAEEWGGSSSPWNMSTNF